jgi:hypothetical protein
MEKRLKPRRVVELPSRLVMSVNKRVFVANELKDVELVIDQVENCHGSKPKLLIRIKRRIFKHKPKHKPKITLKETAELTHTRNGKVLFHNKTSNPKLKKLHKDAIQIR